VRARIVIGGVLVSIGILSAGVESAIVHRDAVSAAGGTGMSDAGGTAGGSGTGTGTGSGTGTGTGAGTGTGSSSTSGALQDGTYTGTAAATQFGNVQVQVTVAPVLRQEALSAQSAEIDTVSGATYTSEGYLQSLQSALDQAR
jgi:major membrane immunogen (membrane-anchored lipoprotein)